MKSDVLDVIRWYLTFIYLVDFQNINFWPMPLVLSHSNLEERVNVREPTTLSKFESTITAEIYRVAFFLSF